MPTTILDPVTTPQPPAEPVRRKQWTREECLALETAGFLDMEQWELVEGELIDRMGKRRPQGNAAWLLATHLTGIFGAYFVNMETPIRVHPEDNAISEPQPDVIVLRRSTLELTDHPRPQELHLVGEVSDTSITFDLTVKAGLYARAGIVEYWVLDVARRRMIVHRDPQAGHYQSILVYTEHESISPLSAPHDSLRVTDCLFPPRPAA